MRKMSLALHSLKTTVWAGLWAGGIIGTTGVKPVVTCITVGEKTALLEKDLVNNSLLLYMHTHSELIETDSEAM